MPRPFLRYAGGKAGLLKDLYKHVPSDFNRYYEPFAGGSALFFSLTPSDALLSDFNGELMNAYRAVRDDLEGLMELLRPCPNEEAFYYEMREKHPMELSPLEAAARFIYLNKTCFNGIYRVNSKNEFNVPFANLKSPSICDESTLRLSSKTLQGVEILASSFEEVLKLPQEGDFVYMDPPYIPVSSTSFVDYCKNGFGMDRQEELAGCFRDLTERGVKCVLSNADVEWIRETYKDFNIFEVMAKRSINSNGAGRGKVGELIVRNW